MFIVVVMRSSQHFHFLLKSVNWLLHACASDYQVNNFDSLASPIVCLSTPELSKPQQSQSTNLPTISSSIKTIVTAAATHLGTVTIHLLGHPFELWTLLINKWGKQSCLLSHNVSLLLVASVELYASTAQPMMECSYYGCCYCGCKSSVNINNNV